MYSFAPARRVDVTGSMSPLSGKPIRFAGHLGLRDPDAPLFAHGARSPAPLDQIERLAELGFAGVQDIGLKCRSPALQRDIGRRMAALGLGMASFGSDPLHWNEPLWSRTDQEARDQIRQSVRESIATVDRVGGGAAICVAGRDPARSLEDQRAGFIDNLRSVAGQAERGGVLLLVEPVADAWIPGMLVARLDEAAAIVRAVDHPAVRLMFDVGHVHMSGEGADMIATLAEQWDIIGGIQAADVPGRVDLGAGTLDWPAILGWIAARGWTGFVEIEHEPVDPSVEGERKLVDRLSAIEMAVREKAA